MPISKDLIANAKKQNAAAMAAAVMSGDEGQIADAFANLCNDIHDAVLQNAAMDVASAQHDATVMAARGLRQLTGAEMDYYKGLTAYMQAGDPRMAITGWENAVPPTIVDGVMEDIRASHPLLDALDMVNTSYMTRFVTNAAPAQTAKWGSITGAIEKELNGAFKVVDVTMMKLTAYMVIPKDLLDLGPVYLDQYIRAVISESIASAIETAVVNGTGKGEPIGMLRDISDNASVVGDVQPYMDSVSITELTAEQLGPVVADLARTPGAPEKARPVTGLIFVVNPFDYYSKVLAATSYRRPDGSYINDVLPIPATIYMSEGCPKGYAVLGMAKKYFFGLGVRGKTGTIDFSDDYKFLEDLRVYAGKFQGNGRPKDEFAFKRLDISSLKPAPLNVRNVT